MWQSHYVATKLIEDQSDRVDALESQVFQSNQNLEQVIEDWRTEQRAALTLNDEIQLKDTIIEKLSQTSSKHLVLIDRLQRELDSALSDKTHKQTIQNNAFDDQIIRLAQNRTEILRLEEELQIYKQNCLSLENENHELIQNLAELDKELEDAIEEKEQLIFTAQEQEQIIQLIQDENN